MPLAIVSLPCALLPKASMPVGVLKLTSISSVCHSHKLPTNNLNCRTLTTTTTTSSGRRLTRPNPTSTVGWGKRWHRCKISTCAPSAHLKISHSSSNPISSSTNNRSNHIKVRQQGFGGQNFLHSSNPLALVSSREKRPDHSSQFNKNISGICLASSHMGPTFSDDDGWRKPPPPPPSNSSAKFLTLPTILTIGRVAAVPLLVATFYADSWWGPNITTGIFIAAAITDWLDGYLARKMNQGTAFGAFLDPVADKLMVAATLVLLSTKPLEAGIFGQAPWLLTVPAIGIIGREITMSAVREWAASQDSKLSEAVAVNNLGKWKTATQMTALTILLATRDSSLTGAGTLVASGVVLLYISAWLSVWSLVVYMRKIWKVLLT